MDQFVKLITESLEYLVVGGVFLLLIRTHLSSTVRRRIHESFFHATTIFTQQPSEKADEKVGDLRGRIWWLQLCGSLAIFLFCGYMMVALGYGALRAWHRHLVFTVVTYEAALQQEYAKYADSLQLRKYQTAASEKKDSAVVATDPTNIGAYTKDLRFHPGLLQGGEFSTFLQLKIEPSESKRKAVVERALDFYWQDIKALVPYVYAVTEEISRANWLDGMKWAALIHCDKDTASSAGPFGLRESKLTRGAYAIALIMLLMGFVSFLVKLFAKMARWLREKVPRINSGAGDESKERLFCGTVMSSLFTVLVSLASMVVVAWMFWIDDIRHHRLVWATDMAICQQDRAAVGGKSKSAE